MTAYFITEAAFFILLTYSPGMLLNEVIKGYFLLLKWPYVTLIPYLPGVRKVSVFCVVKVSLSKFARLLNKQRSLVPAL